MHGNALVNIYTLQLDAATIKQECNTCILCVIGIIF